MRGFDNNFGMNVNIIPIATLFLAEKHPLESTSHFSPANFASGSGEDQQKKSKIPDKKCEILTLNDATQPKITLLCV